MKRQRFFICALVLGVLAVIPLGASASPMIARVGAARVTLTLSPDPPRAGTEKLTVGAAGVTPDMLRETGVTYSSSMPAMNMTGSSGTATAIAGRLGHWTFQLPMATAAQWAIMLHFSRGLRGTANFKFDVIGESPAGGSPMPAMNGGNTAGMSGGNMPGMGGDNVGAWRTAVFALAILLAIGALVSVALAKNGIAAFAGSSVFVLALMACAAQTLFPHLLPSFANGGGLDIYNSAPNAYSVGTAFTAAIIGFGAALIYGSIAALKMMRLRAAVGIVPREHPQTLEP